METCICCGETIHEGRQVCPKCEWQYSVKLFTCRMCPFEGAPDCVDCGNYPYNKEVATMACKKGKKKGSRSK